MLLSTNAALAPDTIDRSSSAQVSVAYGCDTSPYHERAIAAGRKFVENAVRIAPSIRLRRDQSERDGKVSTASVTEMEEIGVFRAMVPMQWGGLEMDPAGFFEGIMTIAAADASAAWIGGQLNVHSFEIALMDERMQREFWGKGPDTRASSSYAPIGKVQEADGGCILNGTWTFSSGVDHAEWVILGGGHRNFVVPKSDLAVDHGSWDVSSLKGTGSKAVTARDLFVPDYRIHKLADTYNGVDSGLATNNRPLFRLSWLGIFNSTIPNSAIGAALGGVEEFIEQSRVRISKQGTGAPVSDNPFMHLKLANALTRVNDAKQRHLANWRGLFDAACRGEASTPLDRMRIRYEAADATRTSFDAISELWPIAGAGAIASTNPLQQTFRDLMAMRNHGSAALEAAAGIYIKTLFGVPPAPFKDFGTLAYYR